MATKPIKPTTAARVPVETPLIEQGAKGAGVSWPWMNWFQWLQAKVNEVTYGKGYVPASTTIIKDFEGEFVNSSTSNATLTISGHSWTLANLDRLMVNTFQGNLWYTQIKQIGTPITSGQYTITYPIAITSSPSGVLVYYASIG